MKTFTFNSILSKKEIYLTLKNLTDSKSGSPLFIGDVTEDSFSIMKYQVFSNNVLNPEIDAIVTESENGTVIYAKSSLNKWDKIGFFIMGIIICSVFTYLISHAIVSCSLNSLFSVAALLVFVIVFYMLTGLVYTLKLKRIIKALKNEWYIK